MPSKSLAELNAAAQREPYVLDIGDGQPVTFQQPTFAEAAAIHEDSDSVIDALKAFAPEADRDRLEAALNASAPTVPQAVFDELLRAFDLGNPPASPSS